MVTLTSPNFDKVFQSMHDSVLEAAKSVLKTQAEEFLRDLKDSIEKASPSTLSKTNIDTALRGLEVTETQSGNELKFQIGAKEDSPGEVLITLMELEYGSASRAVRLQPTWRPLVAETIRTSPEIAQSIFQNFADRMEKKHIPQEVRASGD